MDLIDEEEAEEEAEDHDGPTFSGNLPNVFDEIKGGSIKRSANLCRGCGEKGHYVVKCRKRQVERILGHLGVCPMSPAVVQKGLSVLCLPMFCMCKLLKSFLFI